MEIEVNFRGQLLQQIHRQAVTASCSTSKVNRVNILQNLLQKPNPQCVLPIQWILLARLLLQVQARSWLNFSQPIAPLDFVEHKRKIVPAGGVYLVADEPAQTLALLVDGRFHHERWCDGNDHAEHGFRFAGQS